MIKFIPGFSCWKVNSQLTLVIASCAKTHEVCVYEVSPSGYACLYPTDCPLPDVRGLVPCRWHGLSAVQRANVRDQFHNHLTRKYGEEVFGTPPFAVRCTE